MARFGIARLFVCLFSKLFLSLDWHCRLADSRVKPECPWLGLISGCHCLLLPSPLVKRELLRFIDVDCARPEIDRESLEKCHKRKSIDRPRLICLAEFMHHLDIHLLPVRER